MTAPDPTAAFRGPLRTAVEYAVWPVEGVSRAAIVDALEPVIRQIVAAELRRLLEVPLYDPTELAYLLGDRATELDPAPVSGDALPVQTATAQLDHAVRLREATPGRPEDGPHPASVGEVAREVAAWLVEMDRTAARGLIVALLAEFAAGLPVQDDTDEEAR